MSKKNQRKKESLSRDTKDTGTHAGHENLEEESLTDQKHSETPDDASGFNRAEGTAQKEAGPSEAADQKDEGLIERSPSQEKEAAEATTEETEKTATKETATEETATEETATEETETATGEVIPEDDDVTEPAAKTVEIDEEEMLFTKRKIRNLEEENRKLSNELGTLKDRSVRLSSEYENFRNRTAKEKEEIASDCIARVLGDILPVMDSLERALITETDDLPGLKEGVQLTLDQFVLAMKKMGVELIPTDQGFDPEYHEAVMHEMDESKGEKEITEVFLKGYKKGEKVVRHSVVKVVN